MSKGSDGHPGDPGDTTPAAFGVDSGFTPGHTLPPGLMLREYRIDAVLGEGGFGVVYLALDTALERRVAIKEYLPAGMASRARGSLTVFVKSAGHVETFAAGLRSFVNEARLLARFDHPALVKVHQFWEQNGTAYMVMPYYEGPTLKRTLANLGRTPSEAELRQWLMPLLDALAVLHAERCFHRDIAPDNILITANGPLLLDFGAARRVIGDMTQALTAVLKPGFAPIEQYGEVPGMSQGPWTDIFALASVLYVALAGVKPMSSIERVMDDRFRPLSDIAAGRASPAFLKAIDQALALRPADRPQTVAEFLARLDGKDVGPAPPTPMPAPAVPQHDAPAVPHHDAAAPVDDDATVVMAPVFEPVEARPAAQAPTAETAHATPPASPAPARVPAAPPAPAMPPLPWVAPTLPVPASGPAAPATVSDVAVGDGGRRALVFGLAGGAAVLAAAAGWWWTGRREASETPVLPTAAPRPITPALEPPPAPAPPAAAPAASAAAPEPAPAPAAAPLPAAPAPEPLKPTPTPAPQPEPAAPPPPRPQASPPKPVPARPAVRSDDKPAADRAAAAQRKAANQARCSDILQKASLEPLTPSEQEFLKRECR